MANIDINEIFTASEWAAVCKKDPSMRIFEAASQWQNGFSVASTYLSPSPLAEIELPGVDEKGMPTGWRDLQAKCWELYRTFGPVNASVNSKADYTAGKGFGIDSENLDIRLLLKDLIYSYRNRLYYAFPGWVIRMQAEGELFLLLVFDEAGKATVRVLEPSRIGVGNINDGLLVDPDDATQTLFYDYHGAVNELIPDIRIAFNPELAKKAKDIPGFDAKLAARSAGGGRFKKTGGYKRFIIHWKNLTGIPEYKRDVSVLSTVLEAVNLYWNAIKWQLDHKKAQCAYTNVLKFDDSPVGKIAWQVWNKMSAADKEASGLTKQLTPGSTLILMPGLSYEVKAPQLTRLDGENQDIMNIAGAGARTPQDLWQGQSAGASYASLRSSRSPLELEIENLQYKLGNFLKYEVLRACFHVASKIGSFPTSFSKEDISEIREGKATYKAVPVEPTELIKIAFPNATFEEKIEGRVNAFLGSQHAGLSSIGVSSAKVAEELGIDNLEQLRRDQLIDKKKYGDLLPSVSVDPFARPAPEQNKDKGNTGGQVVDK